MVSQHRPIILRTRFRYMKLVLIHTSHIPSHNLSSTILQERCSLGCQLLNMPERKIKCQYFDILDTNWKIWDYMVYLINHVWLAYSSQSNRTWLMQPTNQIWEDATPNKRGRKIPASACFFASGEVVPAVFALVQEMEISVVWGLQNPWQRLEHARTLAVQAS